MDASWGAGLTGGLLIGLAGAIYLLANGRIMGASGILGEVVDGSAGASAREKLAFLAGLVLVPALVVLLLPGAGPATNITGSLPVVALGGALVGLGTRMALGCTSGHGVCGMSRLSRRSIVATLVYVGGGMAAMTLLRHGLGWL